MSEKLVRLHESTVEKIQAAREKIQELLSLPELPSEDFAVSVLLHTGLSALNQTHRKFAVITFDNAKFLAMLSTWYQNSLSNETKHSNGVINATVAGE